MNTAINNENNLLTTTINIISGSSYNPAHKSSRPQWVTDLEFANEIDSLPTGSLDLLRPEAFQEIKEGNIPDLLSVCEDLYFTFSNANSSFNALQFVPVLKKLELLDPIVLQRFLSNPKTNHVLVQNHLMKVVLIHWKPGKYSSIHGHAEGGCLFKVLSGSLQEKRYSPDDTQKHLSTSLVHSGGMAYIDDTLAYHAVGNTFNASAVSLHVYTPGII